MSTFSTDQVEKEFEELEARAPKVLCPECKEEMTATGWAIASRRSPTHDVIYECFNDECATSIQMELDLSYKAIKARVTTGNHGYQEMYDVDPEKVVATSTAADRPERDV